MKLAAGVATDYHDFTDYHLRNGATAFFFRYGFGVTKTVVYSYDRNNVDWYDGELIYHTVTLLVYLP